MILTLTDSSDPPEINQAELQSLIQRFTLRCDYMRNFAEDTNSIIQPVSDMGLAFEILSALDRRNLRWIPTHPSDVVELDDYELSAPCNTPSTGSGDCPLTQEDTMRLIDRLKAAVAAPDTPVDTAQEYPLIVSNRGAEMWGLGDEFKWLQPIVPRGLTMVWTIGDRERLKLLDEKTSS
jgi:hypothetical protein